MSSRVVRWWREYRVAAIEPRIFLLRQLSGVSPGLQAGIAGLNVLIGLLPGGFVVASSLVVGAAPAAVRGGVGSAPWHSLVNALVLASVVFVLQQVLSPLSVTLGQVVKHRVDGWFHDRLIDVSLRGTTVACLEDPESLANLRMAVENLERGSHTPGDAAAGTLALVGRYARLGGLAVVLGAALSWWAAGAVVVVTMVYRFGHRGAARTYSKLWPVTSPLRRESDYFRELGVGTGAAKELRVFGLTGWIIERYRSSGLAALWPIWRERRRVNVRFFLWRTAFALAVVGPVLAWMLHAAAAGPVTLTQLTLGVQATLGVLFLGEFYHEADIATEYGMLSARALERFERQAPPDSDIDSDADAVAPAVSPAVSIRFVDLGFSYRGSRRPVFDGLNLSLEAGRCTALVGLNGSGKTTLVKLLARLYEPTRGTILVDGRDVRALPVARWRRQIAVIFQDFNHYHLSLAENIAFGAVDHQTDRPRIAATARRAGLDGLIASLPRGLDTVLHRQYEGGVELSGGQWQRVAIARALYAVAAGARVLVLDEPTAALDIRAEAAFFDEFAELTRGLTSLLISHRFSSVRHADRIVVLDHGRVIEDGTHESLLAQGGRYAGMFGLQAARFAAGPVAGAGQ